MTERKPESMPIASWVDRQIATAQQRGEFDELPGAGKPLPRTTGDAVTDWLTRKVRDGDLDGRSMLPPSLKVAKEIEELPATLAKFRTEDRVRRHVLELNDRILDVHRKPQVGPLLRARPLDVEQVVTDWRAARGE